MPLTLVPPRAGRSRNWRLRGTLRGIAVDETTGVASRELADAIRIRRESEILNETVFGARASRRFAEAAILYVETVKPRGTQRDAVIGRRRTDGRVSPCLIEDFGDCLCSAIDQAAVDQVARRRLAGRAPATIVRDFLVPLTAVLRFASKRKWCEPPAFERPRYDGRRRRWATYDEADRLLAAAAPHLRPLLLFLMLAGARLAEAIELDWSEVDLAARWVVFRQTKNGEDRGVPLHPQLVAALANLPGGRAGAVFRTHRARPYADKGRVEGGQIKTAWRTARRRAGIADLRPHDLRHTCSTWLTMAGVHEQVRDEILGHASTDMGRRYAHIPRAALVEAVDRLPWRGLEIAPAEEPRRARRKRRG